VGAPEDYAVDPGRAAPFLAGGRRFLPFLEEGDLAPDMAGLRPRLASWRPGVFSDFVIRREEGALEGLVNLVAVESPGLTGAPALAEEVVAWLIG
jgi:L-2-hydroxyglutarate oxidase LhgO